MGVADGRQHEEELVELEVLDAALDRELGAALRDHLDVALAPPGAVDPHDAGLESRFEYDLVGAFEFRFLAHRPIFPRTQHPPTRPIRRPILAQESESRVNARKGCRMLNDPLRSASPRRHASDTARAADAAASSRLTAARSILPAPLSGSCGTTAMKRGC